MTSRTFGRLIRLAAIVTTICLVAVAVGIVPQFGRSVIDSFPEFTAWYWPWLAFAWLITLPGLVVLYFVWRVSGAVINETVFTPRTAGWVKTSAILILGDAILLFVGSLALFLAGMNHPGVFLGILIGVVILLAFSLCAAVLARYLTRASILQEDSEGTF